MSRVIVAILIKNADLAERARLRSGICLRFIAALIDISIVGFIAATVVVLAQPPEYLQILFTFTGTMFLWPIYNIALSWKWQKTVGKRICGLTIYSWDKDENQMIAKPEISRILLREGAIKGGVPWLYLGSSGPSLGPFLVVSFWMILLFSLRARVDRRSLHDVVTKTQVLKTKQVPTYLERLEKRKQSQKMLSPKKQLLLGAGKKKGPFTAKVISEPSAPSQKRSNRSKKRKKKRR